MSSLIPMLTHAVMPQQPDQLKTGEYEPPKITAYNYKKVINGFKPGILARFIAFFSKDYRLKTTMTEIAKICEFSRYLNSAKLNGEVSDDVTKSAVNECYSRLGDLDMSVKNNYFSVLLNLDASADSEDIYDAESLTGVALSMLFENIDNQDMETKYSNDNVSWKMVCSWDRAGAFVKGYHDVAGHITYGHQMKGVLEVMGVPYSFALNGADEGKLARCAGKAAAEADLNILSRLKDDNDRLEANTIAAASRLNEIARQRQMQIQEHAIPVLTAANTVFSTMRDPNRTETKLKEALADFNVEAVLYDDMEGLNERLVKYNEYDIKTLVRSEDSIYYNKRHDLAESARPELKDGCRWPVIPKPDNIPKKSDYIYWADRSKDSVLTAYREKLSVLHTAEGHRQFPFVPNVPDIVFNAKRAIKDCKHSELTRSELMMPMDSSRVIPDNIRMEITEHAKDEETLATTVRSAKRVMENLRPKELVSEAMRLQEKNIHTVDGLNSIRDTITKYVNELANAASSVRNNSGIPVNELLEQRKIVAATHVIKATRLLEDYQRESGATDLEEKINRCVSATPPDGKNVPAPGNFYAEIGVGQDIVNRMEERVNKWNTNPYLAGLVISAEHTQTFMPKTDNDNFQVPLGFPQKRDEIEALGGDALVNGHVEGSWSLSTSTRELEGLLRLNGEPGEDPSDTFNMLTNSDRKEAYRAAHENADIVRSLAVFRRVKEDLEFIDKTIGESGGIGQLAVRLANGQLVTSVTPWRNTDEIQNVGFQSAEERMSVLSDNFENSQTFLSSAVYEVAQAGLSAENVHNSC